MNSEWAQQPQSQGSLAAPGAQLKAQREAMGWTVEQVADQLKLAPRQVVALEEGDIAALPNLAVVRGFVRAYAKVVKLDAAPLVAMIEVNPVASPEAAPVRREISATFSEARFPLMTKRGAHPGVWVGIAAAVALVAAVAAYKLGYLPATLFAHGDKEVPAVLASAPAAPSAAPGAAAIETVKPSRDVAPLQSPSVPLISVPPVATSNASAPNAPSPVPAPGPATAANATVPAAAAAAVTGNELVLNVAHDSWVQLKPSRGGAPLISRMAKAGSSETFHVTEPMLLIVGKPTGVEATLRGVKLELTPAPGGTTSRLNIK